MTEQDINLLLTRSEKLIEEFRGEYPYTEFTVTLDSPVINALSSYIWVNFTPATTKQTRRTPMMASTVDGYLKCLRTILKNELVQLELERSRVIDNI